MVHSFLEQLALGVEPVPSLDWVTLVGLDPDIRVLLIHLLFSVRVNVCSTQQRIFACLGKLPSEGHPPVVEIPHKAFAAWCYVSNVPQVDHITHLEGISPLDWQTEPCKRAEKSEGTEYMDLDCRWLTLVPPGCASWLLPREADVPLNVF